MQQHDLKSWAGSYWGELDDDARATLTRHATYIRDRYPDRNDADMVDAELTATARYLNADLRPDEAGEQLLVAGRAYRVAAARVRQIARLMVEEGATEAQTARALGVDRMTVRKALGKR